MPDYRSTIVRNESCLVATLSGEIATSNSTGFRNDYNRICQLLAESPRLNVMMDLTQTTFFGSLFVGIMLKLSIQMHQKGSRLIICGLSTQLRQLMRQLLLLEKHDSNRNLLQHFATAEEAREFLNSCAGDDSDELISCV